MTDNVFFFTYAIQYTVQGNVGKNNGSFSPVSLKRVKFVNLIAQLPPLVKLIEIPGNNLSKHIVETVEYFYFLQDFLDLALLHHSDRKLSTISISNRK